MLGIQILGLLFGFFMIYYSFVNFKRKEFKRGEFAIWTIMWVLFMIVTLFPNVLNPLIESLNVSRRLDFLIIVGFIFLIGLGFYSYISTKNNQKKIENIVREIAIKKEGEK